RSEEAMHRALSKLPAFGMTQEALKCTQDLCEAYNRRAAHVKTQMQQKFVYLKTNYKYPYSVLYAFASLWTRNSEVELYPLPNYMFEAQIMAIKSRMGLRADQPIPEREIFFWFCPVCDYIYTLHISGNPALDVPNLSY